MKERSLVAFTLLAQTASGAYWLLAALHGVIAAAAGLPTADRLMSAPLRAVLLGVVLALASSSLHLGSPRTAWRACANLRSSWLSREILFAVLFTLGVLTLALLPEDQPLPAMFRSGVAWMSLFFSVALVWSMARIYRLRTVPAWDSRITTGSFFLSAALLGGLAMSTWLSFATDTPRMLWLTAMRLAVLFAAVSIMLQLVLVSLQLGPQPRPRGRGSRGPAPIGQGADWIQAVRVLLLMGAAVMLAGISRFLPDSPLCRGVLLAAFLMGLASEVIGRLRFYAAREPDLP
jgi:anaerobic dimethyl sulfoxide reductase subunit C